MLYKPVKSFLPKKPSDLDKRIARMKWQFAENKRAEFVEMVKSRRERIIHNRRRRGKGNSSATPRYFSTHTKANLEGKNADIGPLDRKPKSARKKRGPSFRTHVRAEDRSQANTRSTAAFTCTTPIPT